jgi:HK97 gp10 family phage protein
MAVTTWDDRAFQSALKQRMDRLEESSKSIPERMARDMAKKAKSTVARRTGKTAAGIASEGGKGEAELTAPNPYLEFGTSKMDAQPFVRPARAEVVSAYRAGHYKPQL